MISRRQKSWIKFLRNLVAVSFGGAFLFDLVLGDFAPPFRNPARHQTIYHSLPGLGGFFLTPGQNQWFIGVMVVSVVIGLPALFAIRLIGSYDPQSANLPPRPPGVDPLSERRG